MAAPVNVVRSYGGGAVPSVLVDFVGSTDTQFTISPTTGWVENDGSPLGSSGPFEVILDRFTESVEKILCSAVNLSTGVVTVFTSGGFSGRGYDTDPGAAPGTGQPQSHTPGTVGQVQTCWTSVEAAEANQAVARLFGTEGPAPANGDIFTWTGGVPEWLPGAAIPSGELFSTSTATIPNGVFTDVPMAAAINLSGGMTSSGNFLIVPKAGRYVVCGESDIAVSTGATGFRAALFSSATSGLRVYGNSAVADASVDPANIGSTFSKVIVCAATEQLKLQVIQVSNPTGGWPLDFIANGVTNWLTVSFIGP